MELTSTGQNYPDFLSQPWMAKSAPVSSEYLQLDFGATSIAAKAIRPDGSVLDTFTVAQVGAAAGQPTGTTPPPPDNACAQRVQALRETVDAQITKQEQGQSDAAIVAAIERSRATATANFDRQLAAC